MTDKDLIELEALVSTLPNTRVMIHSPWQQQIDCLNKYFSRVDTISIDRWNLLDMPNFKTGMLVLCNVLSYVHDPKLAISNATMCCEKLIIQDLIKRQRGVDSEFGDDGDCMRFSFNGIGNGFSLDYLNPSCFKSYNDGDSKHFIMIV